MLRVLLVVVLVVATVAGQDCVPGAEKVNNKCSCPSPLVGHGDLCCYNPGSEKACWVAGDPVLTSYSGKKLGLDFPCGTTISSTKVSGRCTVNVLSASKEHASGAIYTSDIKIQLIGASRTMTLSFSANSWYRVDSSDGTTRTRGLAADQQVYPTVDGFNEVVQMSYSSSRDLIFFNACGTMVRFRLGVGSGAKQAKAPGVCVIASKSAGSPNPDSYSACTLNKNFADNNDYLSSAVNPMRNYIYNNGVLKQTTNSQYAGQCLNFQNVIKGCQTSDQEGAMKRCAFLLFHSTTKKCLYESNKGAGVFGSVMGPFLKCLQTYCQGTKSLCQSLQGDELFKDCASSLLDCNRWPPYRRVNRFVAGEGEETNFGGEGGNDDGNPPRSTTWSPLGGGILGEGGTGDEGTGGGVGDFNPDNFGL